MLSFTNLSSLLAALAASRTCTLLGMGPLGPIGRKRSVSPSLHAVIKHLLLVVTARKGGLTFALVQVTIIVVLTLGIAQSWGLLAGAARQKHRAEE
jgi:hypothetical protein